MLRRMRTSQNLGDAGCDQQTSVEHPRDRKRRKSRGQSLVEFAILLPWMIMILALAADYGRAFTAYIAVTGAAREGAAYGMQSSIHAADTGKIAEAAKNEVGSGGEIWGTTIDVTSATGTDAQGYEEVTVTVTYSFNPIIPLPDIVPGFDVPSPIPLRREVTMRVIN